MDESTSAASIRCLIAKVGLDGHDRGVHVIARALREAGFDVIYTGLHNAPEDIVRAAVQEDVDVVGISILSGAHNTVIPKIIRGLRENNVLEDILLIVGGTIPEKDRPPLLDQGVAAIFGPGTETREAIEFIRQNVPDSL